MIVNGASLVPDVSGALWWARERLLAVADLHLGKGSAFARYGSLLPPYDSHVTIARLGSAIARYEPSTVVCLGDSFHDEDAASRLDESCRQSLQSLIDRQDWIWIAGNHDPLPPEMFSADTVKEVSRGPLLFRHQPSPGPVAGEICGHLHPSGTVIARGHRMRCRCFASDGTRVILPAFGAYAGGLDVHEEAIFGLFPQGFAAWLIGHDKVRRVDRAHLVRRRHSDAMGVGRSHAAPNLEDDVVEMTALRADFQTPSSGDKVET